VSQKELDLLQLSSRGVAESGTRSAKVMRRQFLQSDPFRRILHDVPDGLLRHAVTQSPAHLGHPTEDLASVNSTVSMRLSEKSWTLMPQLHEGSSEKGARAPEYARSKAVRSFRRNGDIGLADLKIEDWRLQLVGVGDVTSYSQYSKDVTSWMYGTDPPPEESDDVDISVPAKKPAMHEDDAKGAAVSMKPMEMPESAPQRIPGLLLTMADVRKLPRIEMVTEFKCIEGWSEIVCWGGVRLRDFLEAFPPQIEEASQFHPSAFVNSLPEYIAFETPDGQYYVGIERQVALHPQTLLAYEMNGQVLPRITERRFAL
jgi:hypothetical protein